jgi:peptide/nickel transport system substrate-binding protein
VTALIAEAEQSDTTEGQTAKLKAANDIIVADAASDWLYLYPQIVVASTMVSGYPLNGLNSQFFVYDIVKQS